MKFYESKRLGGFSRSLSCWPESSAPQRAFCSDPADLTSGSEITTHIEVNFSGVLYMRQKADVSHGVISPVVVFHHMTALIPQNNHNAVYFNSRLFSYTVWCIADLFISLLPSPRLLTPWFEALIPWSNQGYIAAVRIRIKLLFNHISIDLHLLNIMIIAELVLLPVHASPEQDLTL